MELVVAHLQPASRDGVRQATQILCKLGGQGAGRPQSLLVSTHSSEG